MTVIRDVDELVYREAHMMAVSGWRLYQRWPGGADFISGGSGSGISAGVHVILLILTLGLWLPIMILVEVAGTSRLKFVRLTFDDYGHPRYEPISNPKRLAGAS